MEASPALWKGQKLKEVSTGNSGSQGGKLRRELRETDREAQMKPFKPFVFSSVWKWTGWQKQLYLDWPLLATLDSYILKQIPASISLHLKISQVCLKTANTHPSFAPASLMIRLLKKAQWTWFSYCLFVWGPTAFDWGNHDWYSHSFIFLCVSPFHHLSECAWSLLYFLRSTILTLLSAGPTKVTPIY